MSDINDPAQNESPSAPVDAGQPTAAPAEPAQAAQTESPDDSIGNRAESAAAEGADDSIGNRAEGAAVEGASAEGQAPGEGQGKRRDRKKNKGEGKPGGQGGQQGGAQKEEQRRAFHVGDKVRARIIALTDAAATVDLWGKEQGVLDARELAAAEGAEAAKVGDGVDVVVLQDGARGGNLVVTRDPSRADKAREVVAAAFASGEPIEGLVTGLNRGGLEVDLAGLRAFCPSSQIDARFPPSVSPKNLVLTRVPFKVVQLTEGGREAIVSRRALLEGEVRARAEEARDRIKIGEVVKGIVSSVKDYGVFVDLGGIEGLIHISELTHNRSARPSDVVKVGEEIEAKVLRISTPSKEGDHEGRGEGRHEGKDAKAPEAGEKHAEGEAAPAPKEGEAAPTGKDGEGKKGKRERDKKFQHRRPQTEGLPRVILSRRAIEKDPWDGVEKRYPTGSVHTGKVARMQPFGAFIELAPGVDGLLHVSELGEGRRIEHPNEVLKDGETVTVRVERVEGKNKRISLTRVPEGTTEEQLKGSVNLRPGMVVNATVVEHDAHGFHATIEGVVGKFAKGYIVDRESGQPRGVDLRKAFPVGTTVKVKVTEMDRGRPKLSIRAALHDEERQAYRSYQREATAKTVGTSLADKLRAKLGGLGGSGS